MNILSFRPLGNTVSFTAATVVPDAAQAVSSTVDTPNALYPVTHQAVQYRIVNAGTETVLLGVGETNAAAKAAAASIAAGAVPMLPGAVEILWFPTGTYFTGKTAANTSVVYVTPGEGI